MFASLRRFDRLSAGWLSRLAHPYWLVRLLSVVTLAGSYAAVWLLAAAIISWRSGEYRLFLLSVLGHGGLFLVIDRVIKPRVRRRRPSADRLPLETTSDYSFPSGHAASAAMGMVLLSAVAPALTVLWVSLASLIVFSRLYLLRHYVSDVCASLALGGLAGWGLRIFLP